MSYGMHDYLIEKALSNYGFRKEAAGYDAADDLYMEEALKQHEAEVKAGSDARKRAQRAANRAPGKPNYMQRAREILQGKNARIAQLTADYDDLDKYADELEQSNRSRAARIKSLKELQEQTYNDYRTQHTRANKLGGELAEAGAHSKNQAAAGRRFKEFMRNKLARSNKRLAALGIGGAALAGGVGLGGGYLAGRHGEEERTQQAVSDALAQQAAQQQQQQGGGFANSLRDTIASMNPALLGAGGGAVIGGLGGALTGGNNALRNAAIGAALGGLLGGGAGYAYDRYSRG